MKPIPMKCPKAKVNDVISPIFRLRYACDDDDDLFRCVNMFLIVDLRLSTPFSVSVQHSALCLFLAFSSLDTFWSFLFQFVQKFIFTTRKSSETEKISDWNSSLQWGAKRYNDMWRLPKITMLKCKAENHATHSN